MEHPMTSPSNSAIFYSILFFLPIVLFLFRRQFSRKLNLPPGPTPWPFIGNLNLIGPLPHVSMHSLAQKYGPLIHLKFGLSPVVVGSSAEVAELLLKTHDISFASRPALLAGKYTTYNYSGMATAPYGPYWRQARKICLMELLKAIVKETMRLHPVAPLLLPRVSRDDCRVAGYDILRNTRVVVNVWAIGRDPTMWEKPNEFRPHRFIGKNIDVKGHDFQLLPFGSGRRMCPGYGLGLKVVQSTLANLLHGFEWKLPGDMKSEDLDMDDRFGLTMPRKIPLLIVPSKPRLSHHLYSCE
ncbi:hypothetical protein CUMW_266370 [Citrus unshiu]|uniref:Cytochrome P450 n=1 Tax=Citrus unshiu TaxID=55188 RepID=A0A2H5QVS2_CITUN|nr:hypothetical protein CUMW_266370 [Citrus unshiu]